MKNLKTLLQKYNSEIKTAFKIRLVEERLLKLFAEGRLNGTVHTAVGQEFTGVFISKFLTSDDFITSNHRGHGHYISRTNDVKGLIAELMGKEIGVSGGMGGSQHLVSENYLSNGIQGGMLPIAAGVAYYNKLAKNNAISVSYIGDGTLGEGVVYETLNLASVYQLPMVVVLENNGYAQSTSFEQTFRGATKERAEGFGCRYFKTSTLDLDHLNLICQSALDFVRKCNGPVFLEIETFRLNSHSKGDDNRIQDVVERMRSLDILNQLILSNDESISKIIKEINQNLDEIIDEVIGIPDLYNSIESEKLNQKRRLINITPFVNVDERYNSLIYKSLKNFLERNENSIIIGEDIQNKTPFTEVDYGGAFKVTRNLSDLFPERVLNSPISEAALFGFASGYSLKAGRSFAEIMFGDFTTLIFDQILQHASKFQIMFNNKVKCPVVIRTPMGGKRGYGPTHSQSLEKFFLGIDNFGVVVFHHRLSPEYIFNAINEIDAPIMLVENKILYTLFTNKNEVPGYEYEYSNHLFPVLSLTPNSKDSVATILCYGEVLNEVENSLLELFIDEEIKCDVICPSLISEIQIELILQSAKNTKNLIIIEEGSGYASWGSEVVSALVQNGFSNFKLSRWSNPKTIPSSLNAEMNIMPTSDKIIRLIKASVL